MKTTVALIISLFVWPTAGLGAEYKVSIAPSPAVMQSKVAHRSSAWLGYLIARQQWINKNRPATGEDDFVTYRPRFDEEVAGRDALAELWSNFWENRASKKDAYLDDLLKVRKAKWISEYVWIHCHQDGWTSGPSAERLEEFRLWAATNIADHQVETHGRIVLKKTDG